MHARFEKMFKKLPLKIREQFFKRVDIFVRDSQDPILNNHSVENSYPGRFSINVTGDYRALYEQIDLNVTFMKIGTHPQLYR